MQDRLKSLMTWQEGTMLVGGEWVPSESGQTIEVFNPASGQPIARLANANARDVDRTVAAARDAFPSWRKRDVRERAHYVLQAAAQLRERAEAIAQIATMDNGIPITIQQRLILRSADRLAYYAGLAGEIKGETIPTPGETLNYTVREPYGIAALIIPWNASLLFACGRVAPAVLAGNTVILKPAEQACLAELELGTIFAQVFPPGVVNLLTGDGPSAGTPLVAHP
ncbi:MAG TPA: aldehyde dehydrogenase family protein, partial [bacterium]|nr:aldehyde dehydrogenase family protein [bacterium]